MQQHIHQTAAHLPVPGQEHVPLAALLLLAALLPLAAEGAARIEGEVGDCAHDVEKQLFVVPAARALNLGVV